MEIFFKKLTKLSPTLPSTIYKMVEEAGELNREILKFYPYMNLKKEDVMANPDAKQALNHVVEELLDVAQTMATLLFVLEDSGKLKCCPLSKLLDEHLMKLNRKNYKFVQNSSYFIKGSESETRIALPRLLMHTDLVRTALKIGEEAGELVQFAGKKSGMSGELNISDDTTITKGIVSELFDVAQCCVTMLYILEDLYDIDIKTLLENHASKLHEHGYC